MSLAAISSLAARQIRSPAHIAADAAFAGPELDELVVTTADNLETPERGGTVVRAAAPVPGAPVPLAGLGG